MTAITRITNERAMALTGAQLPCPAPGHVDGPNGGPGLDRVNLRVASMLALADLHECHRPGAGELDIPPSYGAPQRYRPIVRSPSGCALGGVI